MKLTFTKCLQAGGYSERCKAGFRTGYKRRQGRIFDTDESIPGLDMTRALNVALNHFLKSLTVAEIATLETVR